MSVNAFVTEFFEEVSLRMLDEYMFKRRPVNLFVDGGYVKARGQSEFATFDVYTFCGIDSKSIRSGLEVIRINFGRHAIRAMVTRCARPYWNVLVLDTLFSVAYDRMESGTGEPLHEGVIFKDAYLTFLALPTDDMDLQEFTLPFVGRRSDAINLSRVVDNCDWITP